MKTKLFTKAICKGVVDKEKRIVQVIASTGVTDRHGESVNPEGWHLENFMKNPVALIAHDYRSLPVGKFLKVWVEDGKLQGLVQLADTEAGREVFYLIEGGFLNTVSVGFIVLKYGVSGQDPYTIMEQELLEISFVAVPANPEALIQNTEAQSSFAFLEKSLSEIKIKNIVPFEATDKAPEDAKWDASEEMKKLWGDGKNQKQYARAHAWYNETMSDDDGDGYPDAKAAYKLPHHNAKLEVVWRGVAAAMGALLGARGGVDLPKDERKGVYNHLVKHYKQFEKEAPEFKEYTAQELLELDQKGLIEVSTFEVKKKFISELIKESEKAKNIKKIFEEVLEKYKVVEEKTVEKIIKVKDDSLSDDAVKLMTKIRSEMRKSDRHSGISLKLLNSLLKDKSSTKGGDKT